MHNDKKCKYIIKFKDYKFKNLYIIKYIIFFLD